MSQDHPKIFRLIEKSRVLLTEKAAKLFKSDLHVHTLKSHDVPSTLSTEEYATELMRIAQGLGIELMAITDHNTIQEYEVFARAANEVGISLLPGVEITVPKSHVDPQTASSIHVIALHKEAHMIRSILSALNIEETDNPEMAIARTDPIGLVAVLEKVLEKEGIPILAHSSSRRGFGSAFRASYRTVISERLKGVPFFVEIPDEGDTQYFDGTDSELQGIYAPCLFSSDCHTIDPSSSDERKLGCRFSYLKMQKPTFENLIKVLREPKLRVIRNEPEPPPIPRILGIYISGGYFNDLEVPFHPNLNTIIGGRGTGKSTLLSMIQFGFNITPITTEGKDEHMRKIQDLLRDGNYVYIVFYGVDNQLYVLKRSFVAGNRNSSSIKLWQVCEPDQVAPVSPNDLRTLMKIEIYRQGELVEIAKRVSDQLKLIDGYLDNKALFDERETIRAEIVDLAKGMEVFLSEKAEIDEEVQEKEAIQTRIQELSELIEFDFVKHHQKWQDEKDFIERTQEYINSTKDAIETFSCPTPPLFEKEDEDKVNPELLSEIIQTNQRIKEWIINRISETLDAFKNHELQSQVQDLIFQWNEQYKQAEEEFRSRSTEVDLDISAILERLEEQKQALNKIEQELIPRCQELSRKIKAHQNQIDQKILELIERDKRIDEARNTVAEFLSENLAQVKVDFQETRDISEIVSYLEKKFTGRQFNIRNKPEKFATLLKTIETPIEVFQYLKDAEKFEEMVDLVGDKRLITIFQEYLYDEGFLEAITLPAPYLPIIKFQKSPTRYVPLKGLSLGEKCGTILSIILLQKEEPSVLVIDTPESEMDHHHFISQVVEAIAEAKHHQQLIFVTHNPNIPVLADAELTIEVESLGLETGQIKDLGYLDDETILNAVLSLEGGQEAFKRRSRRYGFSLTVN